MDNKGKKLTPESKMLGAGVGLLVLMLIIIAISFTFLINNVLPAVTPGDEVTNGNATHFNLKGFDQLGL